MPQLRDSREAMSTLRPGDRIDRYTLVELIGRGSQAQVWRVVDPLAVGMHRALKLVPLGGCRDADVERIRREGRALARLDHPSLVRCHAMVEDVQRQCVGVILDLVEAVPLVELVDDARFEPRQREHVLAHVAGALAHLHQATVVHRDLKLANVLVCHHFWHDPSVPKNVKLVDLGISVAAGNPAPLTQLGVAVGTLPYMAPEVLDPIQFTGDPAAPRVDVFAFGVLAWRVLGGGHPAGSEPTDVVEYARVLRDAAAQRIAWPRGMLTHRWRQALTRCIGLTAALRPANGAELLRLLQDENQAAASPATISLARSRTMPLEASSGTPRATAPHGAPKVAASHEARDPGWDVATVPRLNPGGSSARTVPLTDDSAKRATQPLLENGTDVAMTGSAAETRRIEVANARAPRHERGTILRAVLLCIVVAGLTALALWFLK
jgi:eukaryotic-like serine/threonine-protein kinase